MLKLDGRLAMIFGNGQGNLEVYHNKNNLPPPTIKEINKINLHIHDPNNHDYDIQRFIFQQDRAPSHYSQWTARILEKRAIPQLEHVGNSLDTNAIESAWMLVRIAITKRLESTSYN